MELKKNRIAICIYRKRAAVLLVFLILFFIFKTIIAAHQKDQFTESSFFLSYRLTEIEEYSFQVLANASVNRMLTVYAQSEEKYQINEWNTAFSEYMESLISDNTLVYDAFFFSLQDLSKAALTMRENLSFSEKAVLKDVPFIARIRDSQGMPLWFNTEKGLFSARLIRNVETGIPIGVLCFVINRTVLEEFFYTNAYGKHLFIVEEDGSLLFAAEGGAAGKTAYINPQTGYYRSHKTRESGFVCEAQKLTDETELFLVLRTGFWGSLLFSNRVFAVSVFLWLVYAVVGCFIYIKAAPAQEEVLAVPPELSMLSPQEFKICTLMADGCTNKEIAYRLNLKEQTVKNYMYAIYKKLNVSGRVAAGVLIHNILKKNNQK